VFHVERHRVGARLAGTAPSGAPPYIEIPGRRLYIVPTRRGAMFAALLFLMLVGSINYNNSLGHLFTFLLTGLACVAMLSIYRNVLGVEISAGDARPVFAGQRATIPLRLHNPLPLPRPAIAIELARRPTALTNLPPDATVWVDLSVPTQHRGLFSPGPIKLSTCFPLGLFRAWTYADLAVTCLVYPAPMKKGSTPPLPGAGSTPPGQHSDEEDFAGLRPYQPGDPHRHLHWKAYARTLELHTKRFSAPQGGDLWLDWARLSERDPETRLSILCRWVLDADAQGRAYGLRLPTGRIPPGTGPSHRHRCLRSLAHYPMASFKTGATL
jgi:uncharacterized protein (DUF58 family)